MFIFTQVGPGGKIYVHGYLCLPEEDGCGKEHSRSVWLSNPLLDLV